MTIKNEQQIDIIELVKSCHDIFMEKVNHYMEKSPEAGKAWMEADDILFKELKRITESSSNRILQHEDKQIADGMRDVWNHSGCED